MNTPLPGLQLRPLSFPTSLTGPGGADFTAMVEVRNLVYAETSGHDDHTVHPAEMLPHFAPDPAVLRLWWLVVLDGQAIGRIGLDFPQETGSKRALWTIELLRAHWRRGIGSVAYNLIEQVTREHRRTVLQT